MQSLTRTAALDGSETLIVDVESCTTSGFAGLQLVGNTSDLCRDGKERAKTALERLGYRLGQKRILINLAPADCRKEANHFDLPIAVSLASLCSERVPVHKPADYLMAAELSLDGQLRPIRAAVPMALAAIQNGLRGIVLPRASEPEIRALSRLALPMRAPLALYFFEHLKDVLDWLFDDKQASIQSYFDEPFSAQAGPNFDDMHLSPELKELAICTAIGRHSVLLRGSPGAGKSMFMSRLPSILAPMHPQQHFEALQTYSRYEEEVPPGILAGAPPFRHPHHSSSPQAMLGTGHEPGDLSLAHGGLLFLDELPEFRRDLLEALREPLETGWVQISRAQKKCIWPADIQFVAACNNCPCGWYGSSKKECRCSSSRLLAYWARISGPILDRIDIHFNMPAPIEAAMQVFAPADGKPIGQTQNLKEAVQQGLEFSVERNKNLGLRHNCEMRAEHVSAMAACTQAQFEDMLSYLGPLQLSNRALLRCFRVARSLADANRRVSMAKSDLIKASSWQAYAAARERGDVSVSGSYH
ncbi:MAG: ATP-binding protein [Proteobacteria bacterium]|nr:ATP-binding protein [Pseudomonadota bacterium]